MHCGGYRLQLWACWARWCLFRVSCGSCGRIQRAYACHSPALWSCGHRLRTRLWGYRGEVVIGYRWGCVRLSVRLRQVVREVVTIGDVVLGCRWEVVAIGEVVLGCPWEVCGVLAVAARCLNGLCAMAWACAPPHGGLLWHLKATCTQLQLGAVGYIGEGGLPQQQCHNRTGAIRRSLWGSSSTARATRRTLLPQRSTARLCKKKEDLRAHRTPLWKRPVDTLREKPACRTRCLKEPHARHSSWHPFSRSSLLA